jgi:superfamily II DNA or RNA helicase
VNVEPPPLVSHKRPNTVNAVRTTLKAGENLLVTFTTLTEGSELFTAAVGVAVAKLKEMTALRELSTIPVDKLTETTQLKLRLTALKNAGVVTVGDVLGTKRMDLLAIPGVGGQTVDAVKETAAALYEETLKCCFVKFTLDCDDDVNVNALTAVYKYRIWYQHETLLNAMSGEKERLPSLLELSTVAGTRIRWRFIGEQRKTIAVAGVRKLTTVVDSYTTGEFGEPVRDLQKTYGALREPIPFSVVVQDYERNSVEYHTLLEQWLPGNVTGGVHARGAAGLVDLVNAFQLKSSGLKVPLRKYQTFGAKFCLTQKRVLLGDEMGLGKTVQALTVLTHLNTVTPAGLKLIVCPASVMTNWAREIETKTILKPVMLHGENKNVLYRQWVLSETLNIVGVVTFDGVKTLPGLPKDVIFDGVVVDEAHYVKNPEAGRTKAIAGLLKKTEHVMFMSGTPLENDLEEFLRLLKMVNPGAVTDDDGLLVAGSSSFREKVSDVYLRRNVNDVLHEMPPLTIIPEWENFTQDDQKLYEDAVVDGNFMLMRRVGYLAAGSAKLERLTELCVEAVNNNRKVVVFSFFRDVLKVVEERLQTENLPLFGVLSGDMPPVGRQKTIDGLTAHQGGAVLCSQITAGGVGLNIQTAEVVILCEPQLKPSTETQAIARAYRLGQTKPVTVYKMLTPDSVDDQIVEMLKSKTLLFDEYARESDTADQAAAADIKVTAAAVLAAERARLRIPPAPAVSERDT